MIIISHITTPLNYRTTVFRWSDFLSIHNFPEVYHGQGISEAVFPAPARRVTGKVHNTTSGSNSSWLSRYILCCRAAARRREGRRSGTYFFRISGEMKNDLCWKCNTNDRFWTQSHYCIISINNRNFYINDNKEARFLFSMLIISLCRKRDGRELVQLRINCPDPSRELECSDVRQSPVPFALKN